MNDRCIIKLFPCLCNPIVMRIAAIAYDSVIALKIAEIYVHLETILSVFHWIFNGMGGKAKKVWNLRLWLAMEWWCMQLSGFSPTPSKGKKYKKRSLCMVPLLNMLFHMHIIPPWSVLWLITRLSSVTGGMWKCYLWITWKEKSGEGGGWCWGEIFSKAI